MSCGPSKQMRELADWIDSLISNIENTLQEEIGDKLNGIVDDVEDKINGVLGKIESAIPALLFPKTSQGLQRDVEDLLKLILIWGHEGPRVIERIEQLKDKWENMYDVDIDNIADLLRQGAIDLENLCKMVDNIKKSGVDFIVTGTPSSTPEIKMGEVLRQGKLPDFKLPKYDIESRTKLRKPGEDFLNAKITRFNFVRGN